jgi:hypothetical protein
MRFPVFLEVFSGSGRLGKAMSSQGFTVLLWDIEMGPEYDLRRRDKQHLIFSWVRSGAVWGSHIGTPCSSFSRARDHGPGPPPLRSDAFPLGLPDLSRPCDVSKVKDGNTLMYFSAALCQLLITFGIKFSLENPSRSRLWICAPFLRLLKRKIVKFEITEFCMWGTDWRKATGFLHAFVNFDFLGEHRCLGAKRGLCKRTSKPHHVLSGTNAAGIFWTSIAEPYPERLCQEIAKAYYNVYASDKAINFEVYTT